MIRKAQFMSLKFLPDLVYPKHVVQRAGESNKSVQSLGSIDSF
jgi:hypothetical protein